MKRFDHGTIQKYDQAENGFLRCNLVLARTGVFPYLYNDGSIVQEAKLPSSLNNELTIKSAKGAPVTDGHPSIGKIDSLNATQYLKGTVLDNVSFVDEKLKSDEMVFDAGLIEDIKSGKKVEVSIGFDCEIENISGVFNGQKYDAIQKNIRINHLAHVEKGRAGSTVRAYFDEGLDFAIMNRSDKMSKVKYKIDEKEFDIDAEVLAFINERQSKIDSIEKDVKTLKALIETLEKEAGTSSKTDSNDIKKIQTKLDAQEALNTELKKKIEDFENSEKNKVDQSKFDAAVSERIDLIQVAKGSLENFKADGLTNNDIKMKIIEKVLPFKKDTELDKLEDYVIDSRYDAALELLRQNVNSQDKNSNVPRSDSDEIIKLKEERTKLFVQ